jgi:hypothetical protein
MAHKFELDESLQADHRLPVMMGKGVDAAHGV